MGRIFSKAFRAALIAIRTRIGVNPGDLVVIGPDGTLPGVQAARAGLYISGPLGTVVVPGAVKVAGTSTASQTPQDFTHTNGRLTFDGPGQFVGLASVEATVDLSVSANALLFIAKNGVPVTPSTIDRDIIAGDPGVMALTFPVVLDPTDYIEVWADASGALTLTAARLLLHLYTTTGAKGDQGPAGPPGGINLFIQATRPTTGQVTLGSIALWKDTSSGKRFVIFNADNVVDAVEGT